MEKKNQGTEQQKTHLKKSKSSHVLLDMLFSELELQCLQLAKHNVLFLVCLELSPTNANTASYTHAHTASFFPLFQSPVNPLH